MGIARARYFALWHVAISQATGTGVPLRIFQMSPADDRLCNEDRGTCPWLGRWNLCLWKKTETCEFAWWFSLIYAICNDSCIFLLLNEQSLGMIRWRTDVSEWNWWIPMYVSYCFLTGPSWIDRKRVGLNPCHEYWNHGPWIIIWGEKSGATIQWVMSNPWMIPRVNDEYPQVSRHWHLWIETGYICWLKSSRTASVPNPDMSCAATTHFHAMLYYLTKSASPNRPNQPNHRGLKAGCCLE